MDHLRTPFSQSLQAFAKGKTNDAKVLQGWSLPCTVTEVISSGIVKVSFEVQDPVLVIPQIEIPILAPEYIRYPIQVGDKGMTVPADVSLGGITGLGTGIPTLSQPANLTGLAFMWLGNTAWEAVDPSSLVLYPVKGNPGQIALQISPSGVLITGTDGNLSVAGNISAGNGASGSFTTPTGQTVTVTNGIVTNLF